MRGILSEAMVMCAFTTNPEMSQFIDPPPGSVIGDRIKFDGYEGVIYTYCCVHEILREFLNKKLKLRPQFVSEQWLNQYPINCVYKKCKKFFYYQLKNKQ